MNPALRLRITLLVTACIFSACSLDPQPEPPMDETIGGGAGAAGFHADASAAGGSAGSVIGQGGGQSQGGGAGAAGATPMDAGGDVACTGDNCYCNDPDAACDAGCEGGDADAECDADVEGGPEPDADQDAAPDDDGAADDALTPESGP